MTVGTTVTAESTLRTAANLGNNSVTEDVLRKLQLGEALSVLFDVANPNVVVAATTVGSAISADTGSAVVNTGVTTPANDTYTKADQTALANCVLALVVQINLMRTDLLAAVAEHNKLRVDVLALRAELASTLAGTLGGATQTGVTITSHVATLSGAASSVFQVRAYGGTDGVKQLVPAGVVPAVGQVSWDGNTKLTFNVADANTTCDVVYAKADGSQKCSALMQDFPL